MSLARYLRRPATILGVVVAVGLFLFVVTAVIPRTLLPFYIGGWFLTLTGVNLKGTRLAGGKTEAVVFLFDGTGLALFGVVGLMGFRWSHSPAILAALVGFAAVIYSMSL